MTFNARKKTWFRPAAFTAAGLALLTLVLCRIAPRLLPYAGEEALRSLRFSMVVLDADGAELQVLPLDKGLRRVFVPLEKIPRPFIDTLLGAEDRRFWLHPGFDPISLVRALGQNASSGERVSGASTIAMQLARIIRPRERSIRGKIAEAWQAMQLESRLGKRGVLELYLNLLPFGRNVEGFEAAARIFFGRSITNISREEFSLLAVMPRSPSAYDAFAMQANARRAALRLGAPREAKSPGRGNAEDRAKSAEAAIDLALARVLDPTRPGIWPFRTPQFILWLAARDEWKNWDSRRPFPTGIEPALQSFLENLLASSVAEARRKRVSNAAALFVRPDDMRIAAWVGSTDFFDATRSGQIDGVTMRRQPGSTLKPFLYALALSSGFTASSVLPDIPSDFGGEEIYVPANFNNQFNGPVRLRQALASSLNVPAVYSLERVGVLPFTELLLANGFASLQSQAGRLGLGLALGNAEVSLFELVQGYGLFLRDGRAASIGALAEGLREARRDSSRQLVDPRIARLVRDMLTRHPDRTLAFGSGGNTRLRFEGAIKTGTSNQFNNIWAIGFTTDLLGGVWMGNFSGSTVIGTADSGYPAGVISKTLEAFSAHESFPPLSGLEKKTVCSLSGKLATDACPHRMDEWFLPGTEPASCDWHRLGQAGLETLYPQEYRAWLSKYRYKKRQLLSESETRILRPAEGALFYIDPAMPMDSQAFPVEATGSGTGSLFLDGRLIARGTFPLNALVRPERGVHRLELEADNGERAFVGYEVR